MTLITSHSLMIRLHLFILFDYYKRFFFYCRKNSLPILYNVFPDLVHKKKMNEASKIDYFFHVKPNSHFEASIVVSKFIKKFLSYMKP